MGAFSYTAVDAQGRTRKGIMEGDNPRAVRSQLRSAGLTPLEVSETRARKPRHRALPTRRGINSKDLALLSRQLSTLVRSGQPVDEALGVVANQSANSQIKSLLLAVRSKVREGVSLASALESNGNLFPEIFRASVSAGEQSGQLGEVLLSLADYAENSQDLRQKIQLAMVYPAIVTLVALGVVTLLLVFVVPQVVQIFIDMKQQLPPLTQAMITLSSLIRDDGVLILALLTLLTALTLSLLRQPGPQYAFHRFLLMLPLISRTLRGINSARFVRTLGLLTRSGVPVLEGLTIASRVLHNLPMRRAIEEAANRVREGESLHGALQRSTLFTPITLSLIASGESSGDLAGMLEHAATTQEREMHALISTLVGLFEPLMILFMGGVVLLIVLAILLPIFELNQLIRT